VKNTFEKAERLSRHGLIRKLFAEGSAFHIPLFRVTWLRMESENDEQSQIMLSVPKHNIHGAVARNLIRRRMREAYRQNKHELGQGISGNHQKLLICITYTAKEILPYADIQAKIILLLQRLTEENEKLTR
jgi:ribonuclease P protein component